MSATDLIDSFIGVGRPPLDRSAHPSGLVTGPRIDSRTGSARARSLMPGHALRRRASGPGWYRRRLLGSGGAAAPGRESLALLPSGPDAVRTLPVRGTRPSTPRV